LNTPQNNDNYDSNTNKSVHHQRSLSNADLEKIKKQDDIISKSVVFENKELLNVSSVNASPAHVAKIKVK